MKIAIVVPGGVDRSGTRRVIPALLWLIERLAVEDEVHVFALQQEKLPARWPLLGAQVHNAGARPRRLRALGQMLGEHRRGRFDVVHAFWAGGPGVAAALFSRLTGVPMLLTLPGGDLCAMPDIGYGARLTRRGRFWVDLAVRQATRVIVPSEWMRSQAAALGVNATCIRYGVALDQWPTRMPIRRVPGTPLRIVQVANLNRVKDQETLLGAMRILATRGVAFEVDVIGLDTLGGAVQRRCHDLGLTDHVRFHGFVEHDAVRPFIERADLMVVSSRHEGVPIAALEAAVAGVPTVGTAVGQITDWAPDAAIAVPIGDAEALADAIERLAGDEDESMMATPSSPRCVSFIARLRGNSPRLGSSNAASPEATQLRTCQEPIRYRNV
jgi:glycosyltransferase involved in cell wall biosynthesis